MSQYKILIYGYGNPGRQDDGLGNALIEKLEVWAKETNRDDIEFDSNYQLNIEDADAIAKKDITIFADASIEDIEDYILTEVDGESNVAFTTHSASPGYIYKLCKDLYNKTPSVHLLHIKGYEWAFKEGVSLKASENLEKAFTFIIKKLEQPDSLIV